MLFEKLSRQINLHETDVIIWDEASMIPSREMELVNELL